MRKLGLCAQQVNSILLLDNTDILIHSYTVICRIIKYGKVCFSRQLISHHAKYREVGTDAVGPLGCFRKDNINEELLSCHYLASYIL